MPALLKKDELEEVRQRIRRIAEKHIAKDGPNGISLRKVAAELGWTAASLYRYYASKADLIDGVCVDINTRFSDAIDQSYHSTDDLWDRSRLIGDTYLRFAQEEPAAYQLMSTSSLPADHQKSPALLDAERRSHETLVRYVKDMVDAGILEGDPVLIAHSFWAVMHGLVMLESENKLHSSPDFATLRRAAVRLIMRGARPGE